MPVGEGRLEIVLDSRIASRYEKRVNETRHAASSDLSPRPGQGAFPDEGHRVSAAPRHDWTIAQARSIHDLPLLDLLFQAQSVHRAHHPRNAVQLCSLLSIKTGACPEDCAYCPQSGHHNTELEPERLLSVAEVLGHAVRAKEAGASRFCMGAAWRSARGGMQWTQVKAMVSGVRALGMEACLTAGMLTDVQAEELKAEGLTAYNHNIDTSKTFYDQIITTRTFEDRLQTLGRVQRAGISVCSGGIIGMGEQKGDRMGMLVTLANLSPQPESVPINALVAVAGTPLEGRPPVDPVELVRMCATARIMMPKAMVRLSAGRNKLGREAQLLCFAAGANSIFYGDTLLTTDNPEVMEDRAMFAAAGIEALVPEGLSGGQLEALEPDGLSAAQAQGFEGAKRS